MEPEEYEKDPRWQNLVDALVALRIPASLIENEEWPGVCIGHYDPNDSMSPVLVIEGQMYVETEYLLPGEGDGELRVVE